MPRFLAEVLTWSDHSWLRPLIRAAIQAGQPPVAFIIEEPRSEWNVWDYRIAKAETILASYEIEGIPQHIEEDPNMDVQVRKHVSRAQAAVERAQAEDERRRTNKKSGEVRPAYGQRFYPVMKPRDPAKRQSLMEWLSKSRDTSEKAAMTGSDARIGVGADMDMVEQYRARRSEAARAVDSMP